MWIRLIASMPSGAVEVRLAELPEAEAQGLKARDGHVHGSEPAVHRPAERPELACPESGEGLHLVTTREEGVTFMPQRQAHM